DSLSGFASGTITTVRGSGYYVVPGKACSPRIDPAVPPHRWELDPAGAALLDELAGLECFAGAYRVVSSTEPKAVGTAAAIVKRHSLPAVEPMDALGEVHKTGFVDDHDGVMVRLFREPDRAAAPGWETAAAALKRFGSCLDQLMSEADGRDLIVAAHATVLSLWLAALNGQGWVNPADWRAVGMPDLAVVDAAARRVVHPFGAWRTQTVSRRASL
ncbi:MAG: hypothetical protein JWN15_2840, partial [Firmicutes bacterium]|nr:hypothetical protein [Bacillota bacterium]